jgi:HD-GYP domain-containing protein (c-di-GMP phosphodiesterase class II)
VIKQRIVLRSLGPERKGAVWEADASLRVGRLLDLEVVLTEDSVSRQHAEMALTAEGWVVRDLGSTNGTFLNGVQIGRAGQKLRDGDIVQCGNILFAVKLIIDMKSFIPSTPPRGLRVEAALTQSWEDVLALQDTLRTATDPRRARKLLALAQVGRSYQHAGSLDAFLESFLWEAAEVLDAQHGCVILRNPTTGRLAPRAVFAWGSPLEEEVWLRNDLVSQALKMGRSLLCGRGADGADLAGRAEPIRSMTCALLRTSRKHLGVLCLARPDGSEPFRREDLALADALALCVSDGVDNLEQVLEKERNLFVQTLTTLAQMVELRKGCTGGQPRRVTDYALLLAGELKAPSVDCYHLQIGTPLLDLGKIGLSDALLRKALPLTGEEAAQVSDSVLKGASLLEAIPGLAALLPIVRNYREHWDGTGYPDSLAGEQIPLVARIVAVADAFEEMTSERPDGGELPLDEALAQIERGAGRRFDPGCVKAFLRLRPELQRLIGQRQLLTTTMSKAELAKTRREIRLQPR